MVASVAIPAEAQSREGLRAAIGRYGVWRGLWRVVAGPPRVRTLKPRGYFALVERFSGPLQVMASIALTTGAVFVMAQGLIQQVSDAIAAGRVPSFQTMLALSTLFVIGFLIDTTLLTAGSRFRMHALRAEWGWACLAGFMLLLTVGVEGMTWSYLLYELEPTVLPANVAAFIRGIPSVLFFVRAFMGPFCLLYLTAGVLPLTIQRGDVDREVAASTGGAIVTLVHELIQWIQTAGISSERQAVELLGLLLAVFRVSGGHQTEAQDRQLVASFRDLQAGLDATGNRGSAEVVRQLQETVQQYQTAAYASPEVAETRHEAAAETAAATSDTTFDIAWGDSIPWGDPTDAGTPVEYEATQPATDDQKAVATTQTRGKQKKGAGKPMPGSAAYDQAIDAAIRRVMAQRRPLSVENIAEEMGEQVEIARPFIAPILAER